MLLEGDVVRDHRVLYRVEDAGPLEVELEAAEVGKASLVCLLGALASFGCLVFQGGADVHDAGDDEGRRAHVVDAQEECDGVLALDGSDRSVCDVHARENSA